MKNSEGLKLKADVQSKSDQIQFLEKKIEEYEIQANVHKEYVDKLMKSHKQISSRYEDEIKRLIQKNTKYQAEISHYESKIKELNNQNITDKEISDHMFTEEEVERYQLKIKELTMKNDRYDQILQAISEESETKYQDLLAKYQEKVAILNELESDIEEVSDQVFELEKENLEIMEHETNSKKKILFHEYSAKCFGAAMKKLKILF